MPNPPPGPPTAFAPAPVAPPMPVLTGDHDALPPGTRLAEFEILRVIGIGGFGIVYLAMDHALERQVAIKEYMPGVLAGRGAGSQISLRSTAHADTFATGLRSFVNEAKLLARFDHPSLVKVYRFWEANNTAYMVMPYYDGITLQAARRAIDKPPSEARLRALLEPLLGALEVMHGESCYHRDIAPDNILLLRDGQPVLLDFGAARQVIGDRTQNLTAILKPAFAPIEQYADVVHLKQGPWTDLYAVGAVIHYCLSGQPPMPSAARAVHDELKPAVEVARVLEEAFPGTHYSPAFLRTIDWALAIRPQDRPQSVAELRAALQGQRSPAPALQPATAGETGQRLDAVPLSRTEVSMPAAPPAAPRSGARKLVVATAGVLAVAVLTAGGLTALKRRTTADAEAPAVAPAAVPAVVPPSPVAAVARSTSPDLGAAAVPAVTATASTAAAGPAPVPAVIEASVQPTPGPVSKPPSQPVPKPAAPPEPRADASRPAEARPLPEPAQTEPAPAVAEAGPSSPREACGRRVLLALWRCMQQECKKPRFAQHRQCVKLREEEARRARRDHGF